MRHAPRPNARRASRLSPSCGDDHAARVTRRVSANVVPCVPAHIVYDAGVTSLGVTSQNVRRTRATIDAALQSRTRPL